VSLRGGCGAMAVGGIAIALQVIDRVDHRIMVPVYLIQ
jgi:hypothetical protein